MREDLAAFRHKLLLQLGILEGSHIRDGPVTLSIHPDDLRIFIGNKHRAENNQKDDQDQHDHASNRQRILHQAAHTVLEKGNGFAHHILLLLFLICRLFKLLQINLQT